MSVRVAVVSLSDLFIESGEKTCFWVEDTLRFRNKASSGNIVPGGAQAPLNLLGKGSTSGFSPWLADGPYTSFPLWDSVP